MIRSPRIREAAKGEKCTLNIAGVCNYDPETVVFCHFPDYDTHGVSMKSCDLSGGFGCSACHDAIDRRVRDPEFVQHAEFYLRRSQLRTMRRLVDLGVVQIA